MRASRIRAATLVVLLGPPGTGVTAEPAPLRAHVVPIVNQGGFLERLIRDVQPETRLEITAHHGAAVAAAVRGHGADLVITHADLPAMHALMAEGRLGPGALLFANPIVLLGPPEDPAGLADARSLHELVARMRAADACLWPNPLPHLTPADETPPSCPVRDTQPASGLGAVLARRGERAHVWWGLHPYLMAGGEKARGLRVFLPPDPLLLRPLMAWPVRGARQQEVERLLTTLREAPAQKKVAEFRFPEAPALQVWFPYRAADPLARIESRGHLIILVKNDHARTGAGHRDPAHEVKRRFEARLVRELARALPGDPDKAETLAIPGTERIAAIAGGMADLGIAMFKPLPADRSPLDYSRPYARDGLALLYRAADPAPEVGALAGLRILRLAKGFPIPDEALAQLGLDAGRVQTTASVAAASEALLQGRADAFLAPAMNLDAWLGHQRQPGLTRSRVLLPETFAVAMPRDSPALRATVDGVIARLARDGVLKRWWLESGRVR